MLWLWYSYLFFGSGYITVSEWCQAMEETTHLGLPWRMLKDKLVHTDPETRKVRYMDTFELSSNVRNFFLVIFSWRNFSLTAWS